jgi:integrase
MLNDSYSDWTVRCREVVGFLPCAPFPHQGKRDRAILSTLLYHGLRREELCSLQVRDIDRFERFAILITPYCGKAETGIPGPRVGDFRL